MTLKQQNFLDSLYAISESAETAIRTNDVTAMRRLVAEYGALRADFESDPAAHNESLSMFADQLEHGLALIERGWDTTVH